MKVGVAAPDVGRPEKGLLAGADEGVLDAPKRFEEGAAVDADGAADAPKDVPNRFEVGGAVVVAFCAFEPKLKGVVGVAVAVALSVPCACVPAPNMFCWRVSCWLAPPFCAFAPKPPKAVGAVAVLLCPAPNPPNMLLGADVVAVFCAGVLLAPKLNRPEVAVLAPKPAPVLAALTPLLCDCPPKMLEAEDAPNMLLPPEGCDALPFIEDAPFCEKMPLPPPLNVGALGPAPNAGALLPALKLKAFADGGWNALLGALLLLLPPKEGKELLEKAFVGAGCCAGGKLVAPPPKGLLALPNMLLLLFPPTAGDGAEKPKPCCDAPRLDGVCACELAMARMRIARRDSGVL